MPKVSTRTRQELVRVVEIWIIETKQETRMGQYGVSLVSGDYALVTGQRYGEWFGMQKDGQEYQVTHIPTGLGCGEPLPKPAAIKLMRGLYDLVEWDFSTPAGFNAEMRPICRLMHDYCSGDSMKFSDLERLVRIIEGRHRSGTPESPARGSAIPSRNSGGIPPIAAKVELGDDLPLD